MFDVVTCGFPPAPLASLPAHRAVAELPHPGAPDFFDCALDLLDGPVLSGRTVLLLHDAKPPSERRLRMLRAMLRRSRVLPVGVRLPVTGLSGLATVLATLASSRLNPGAVVGSIAWAVALVNVRAVAATVSKLDYPGVGVGQQLATLVPGSTLLMNFGEGVAFGAAARAPLGPPGAVALVRSGDARLAPKAGAVPPGVVEYADIVAAPELMTGWWGTPKYYEHCAVPLELGALGNRIKSFPWRRCPECGDAMAHYCQFCSAQEVYA